MIKAVIFDFFGVVGLSTYAMLAEKYNYTPTQHSLSWDLHRALDAGYVTHEEFIQQYAEIIGISKNELHASFTEAERHMGIHKPVLDLADTLRETYKVGLLTNVSSDAYRFVEPIASHFDAVVASYQVRLAKPDVAIFEIMADRLGVDVAECIMIDDNETNCEGARAAGMEAICYTTLADTKTQLATFLP
jgi:putative hydrolase of the HAD superfamily